MEVAPSDSGVRWPLLAVSTSGAEWSLWLGTGPDDLGEELALSGARGRARDLLGTIDALLRGRGLRPADLSALAVDVGPGSFTSLRMGLATVRALGWARSLPVCGVHALAALAAEARGLGDHGPVVARVAARKGWWYVGFSPSAGALSEHLVEEGHLAGLLVAWQAGESQPLQLAGDWSSARPEAAGHIPTQTLARVRARRIAQLAVAAAQETWQSAMHANPAYLSASEAEVHLGWTAPAVPQPAEQRAT